MQRTIGNCLRARHALSPNRFQVLRCLKGPRPARMASTFPNLPIFRALASHDPDSTAIIHSKSDRRFTYGDLLKDVEDAKASLYTRLKTSLRAGEGVGGQRVAFLVENGYDYVVTLLSIFACDAIAVPLSPTFPASETRYILDNSQAATLLASDKFKEQAKHILSEGLSSTPTLGSVDKRLNGAGRDDNQLLRLPTTKGGLMLYTSGTTSRPKGVVIGSHTLTAQVDSLLKAWEYSSRDHLLHLLPLHHIHGTVNALLSPLTAGSKIEFLFPFNADSVWERLSSPFLTNAPSDRKSHRKEPITFLTAVPTMYHRLISAFASLPPETQDAGKVAVSPDNLRLNISGSAALPAPTKQAWSELSSGNVLLERYGMTEVGMALSCGLAFEDRVDGSVGWPLPNVEARLVDTETGEVIKPAEEGGDRQGEIQLRGPTIFTEYWRNPEASKTEFVMAEDGKGKWFRTGDIARRESVTGAGKSNQKWVQGPCFFIQGRKSTDIIKSGGEKVSALEIEREMLSLPEIAEVAVVGVASEQWGQKVCAVVVLKADEAHTKSGKPWGAMDMRRALKDRLAAYKVPQELKVVDEIQKNAMGKVEKKKLVREIFGQ